MKHFVMAVALVGGMASSALAAGPYAGAAFGPSFFHDSDMEYGPYDTGYVWISGGSRTISYQTGIAVNAVGGYNFDGLRVEGEYGYKHADVDTVSGHGAHGMDTGIHSVMANLYYDFLPNRVATPVVGVGLGILFGDFTDSSSTYHDSKGGYQATVGVAFKAGSRVNIDLYYRLQGAMGDFEVATSKVSYLSSNLLAGARFNF